MLLHKRIVRVLKYTIFRFLKPIKKKTKTKCKTKENVSRTRPKKIRPKRRQQQLHLQRKKTKTTIDEPQEKDYSKMLVTELREELKGRGLDHKGKKADLIKRLEEADNPIDFWGMFVSFVKLISFFR